MRVSVVGTGYVGLVTGAGLAEIGNDVVCVDLDRAKVDAVNQGRSLIYEDGLDDLVATNAGERLRAHTSTARAVADTDLTLITVDTPFDGERIDLSSIEAVSRDVGAALANKDGYHVVVVKSTVVPGTTDSVVLPILEEASGKLAGPDFGVGMNPEFLREGQAVEDFLNPDRIVLGGIDDRTIAAMAEMYKSFDGADVVTTSTRAAEMIKYVSNSLLATLISFSNEMANLASAVGVDSSDVMPGVHLDRRLSPFLEGSNRVRPGILSYIAPGCGFGGSCFPKDVRSLAAFGRERGSSMQLLEAVMSINDAQPARMVELLKKRIPDLGGSRIAILGAAFKPGTNDVRESPALGLAKMLMAEGARVTVIDPVAVEQAREVLGDTVDYETALEPLVDVADAFLLVTPWPVFADLPALLEPREKEPVVVDGRRFYSKDAFRRYEAIGR